MFFQEFHACLINVMYKDISFVCPPFLSIPHDSRAGQVAFLTKNKWLPQMEHHEWLKDPLENQLISAVWCDLDPLTMLKSWGLWCYKKMDHQPSYVHNSFVICLWGGNDIADIHASKRKHQPNDRPSNEMIKMRHPLRTPEPPGRVSSQIPHTWCALSMAVENPRKWVKWISPKKQLKYLAVLIHYS